MGEKSDKEKRVLEYDRDKPADPWKRGWRSWLLEFLAEAVAQIVLPIAVGAAVICYLTWCKGR